MSEGGMSVLAIYQAHLREGRLAYQYSLSARRAVFYPRELCPYTGDDSLEWRIASGLGRVYSTTAVNVRHGEPYNVALIDCDEGFRLMSRVEGIAAERVRIGQRVRYCATRDEDDEPYPVFVPVEAE
jgi:uncharacterized OB-fold protein